MIPLVILAGQPTVRKGKNASAASSYLCLTSGLSYRPRDQPLLHDKNIKWYALRDYRCASIMGTAPEVTALDWPRVEMTP